MFAAGSKNQNLLAPLRQQFRQQLLTSGARLSPPSVVSRDPDNLDRYLQKATASLMSWSSSAVVTTAWPVAFSHQIRPAKTKSPGEWPGLSIRNRCGNTTTHAESLKKPNLTIRVRSFKVNGKAKVASRQDGKRKPAPKAVDKGLSLGQTVVTRRGDNFRPWSVRNIGYIDKTPSGDFVLCHAKVVPHGGRCI